MVTFALAHFSMHDAWPNQRSLAMNWFAQWLAASPMHFPLEIILGMLMIRLRMVRALIWALSRMGRTTLKGEAPHSTQSGFLGLGEFCTSGSSIWLDLWALGILSPRSAWAQPPVGVLHAWYACVQIFAGAFSPYKFDQISRQDFTRNHLRQTSISVVSQMMFERLAMCKMLWASSVPIAYWYATNAAYVLWLDTTLITQTMYRGGCCKDSLPSSTVKCPFPVMLFSLLTMSLRTKSFSLLTMSLATRACRLTKVLRCRAHAFASLHDFELDFGTLYWPMYMVQDVLLLDLGRLLGERVFLLPRLSRLAL